MTRTILRWLHGELITDDGASALLNGNEAFVDEPPDSLGDPDAHLHPNKTGAMHFGDGKYGRPIVLHGRRRVGSRNRIEIDGTAGDVIDIRAFRFTLLEINNWVDADQSTGRLVHVPNGRLFKYVAANYTERFFRIWHEIPVSVTFESDWRRAEEVLREWIAPLAIAEEELRHYQKIASAARLLHQLQGVAADGVRLDPGQRPYSRGFLSASNSALADSTRTRALRVRRSTVSLHRVSSSISASVAGSSAPIRRLAASTSAVASVRRR
ncbi:MAG: mechanosensitive ion channel family protein, partial [Acidimicrobiia bacterium]|nr:mechanosensitive ion channel family protein [Acidimicrobiia bacterium]